MYSSPEQRSSPSSDPLAALKARSRPTMIETPPVPQERVREILAGLDFPPDLISYGLRPLDNTVGFELPTSAWCSRTFNARGHLASYGEFKISKEAPDSLSVRARSEGSSFVLSCMLGGSNPWRSVEHLAHALGATSVTAQSATTARFGNLFSLRLEPTRVGTAPDVPPRCPSTRVLDRGELALTQFTLSLDDIEAVADTCRHAVTLCATPSESCFVEAALRSLRVRELHNNLTEHLIGKACRWICRRAESVSSVSCSWARHPSPEGPDYLTLDSLRITPRNGAVASLSFRFLSLEFLELFEAVREKGPSNQRALLPISEVTIDFRQPATDHWHTVNTLTRISGAPSIPQRFGIEGYNLDGSELLTTAWASRFLWSAQFRRLSDS